MKKNIFVLGNSYKSVFGKKTINNEYKMDKIDLTNMNDSHSLIVNYIIKNKKKKYILDVGANTGVLGNTLVNYNSIIDGIEYNTKSFDVLKKNINYDNVYNISICDFNNEFYKNDKKYDYVIFADVLEHLENPDEVIINITNKLTKKGKILISIPNISHLDVIIQLINGKFNYNEEGILDSTHLRFFTNSSFIDMINNIEEKTGIFYNVSKFAETKVLPPYANAIDTSIFNMFDNLYDFSIVQNLYEISISQKKQIRNLKNKNIFKIMNDNYNKMLENKLSAEKKVLELTDELNHIKSTVRFKLFFNIPKKIKKVVKK